MDTLSLAVYALAVWRLSSLLVHEAGPFDVFTRIRARVGIEHDEYGNACQWPQTWAAGVLTCVWCCSMNLALVLVPVALLWPQVAFIACLPFALSTGAVIVEVVTHGTR